MKASPRAGNVPTAAYPTIWPNAVVLWVSWVTLLRRVHNQRYVAMASVNATKPVIVRNPAVLSPTVRVVKLVTKASAGPNAYPNFNVLKATFAKTAHVSLAVNQTTTAVTQKHA